MTTAQQVTLGIIIFIGASFALALLWGKFAKTGRGPESTALFDKVEAIKADQAKKEEGWIANLELNLPIARDQLAVLKKQEPTPKNDKDIDKVSKTIAEGERTLVFLKTRRRDAQESAATIFEGRM